MTLNHRRCPSPAELERAFWSHDPDVRGHADGCDRCGPQYAQMTSLAELGRTIDAPPSSSSRREEMRTALLASDKPARLERRPWPRWQLAMPLAAAAAAAIVWWQWPATGGSEATASVHRATTLEHDGVQFMKVSSQPDEIVRLVDGTLSVEVEPLTDGERFRVITGDAEVEVVGTAFDVTAVDDRLVAVRVVHGIVEVRAEGADPQRLTAGDLWKPGDAREASVVPADEAPLPTVETGAEPAAIAAVPEPSSSGPAVIAPTPKTPRPTARSPRAPVVREPPDRDVGELSATEVDAGSTAAPPQSAPDPAQEAFDEGWAAIRSADFDAAAAAFALAAESTTRSVKQDAMYWRAVALARGKRERQAERAFVAFLDAYPSASRSAEASVMLGWILYDRGELAGAKRRFRAGLEASSERVRKSATEGVRAVEQSKR